MIYVVFFYDFLYCYFVLVVDFNFVDIFLIFECVEYWCVVNKILDKFFDVLKGMMVLNLFFENFI